MSAFEELKQKVITHIAEIERVAYIQAQYREESNTYQSCESRITQQKLLIEAALDEYEKTTIPVIAPAKKQLGSCVCKECR